MRLGARLALPLLLGAASVACSSGRRSEPLIGAPNLATPQLKSGEQAFFLHCHKCHPSGDAGLGPAINNKALPSAAVKLQVRTGAGAMPSIDDNRLSDQDLEALVAYLEVMRQAN
jgi:mono/diheme cytochrome c family protein